MASVAEALSVALDHHLAGRLDAAATIYRRILDAVPEQPEALHLLGMVCAQSGHLDDAIALISRSLARRPDNTETQYDLARVFRAASRRNEAEDRLRRTLALAPGSVAVLAEFAGMLSAAKRFTEAALAQTRAMVVDPSDAEARARLATLLHAVARDRLAAGDFAAAVIPLERAIRLDRTNADRLSDLGGTLYHMGRLDNAAACLRAALAAAPAHAEALGNLASTHDWRGEHNAALAAATRAARVKPDFAAAHNMRGVALTALGRFEEADNALGRALAIDPSRCSGWINMGVLRRAEGRSQAAVAAYGYAVAAAPNDPRPHRELLAATLYDPAWTPERRFAEHCLYAARHAAQGKPLTIPTNNGNRLRIGYLSSDFRGHPVARNLEPLLRAHDRSRFEITLYAAVSKPDTTTDRLRGFADRWRCVLGLTDEALAQVIRKDEIDVLVSLAGHFDENNLLIAAHKAAPVQISFHDPVTSGVAGFDYLISDRVLTPRPCREPFVERLLRLPSFYLHDPIADAPELTPPPCAAGASPVFGCFNNPAKVGDQVLALWAETLRAVPESRLLLKYQNAFSETPVRRRVLGGLGDCGIGEDRVIFASGKTELSSHLALYGSIDVALDPFPFCGSTTTFEALWMGVPVVTLPGDTMVSRWSASILTTLGLNELIAADPAGYIRIAATLAADRERLAGLRSALRPRLAASPMCDARLKTRHIERLFSAVARRSIMNRNLSDDGSLAIGTLNIML